MSDDETIPPSEAATSEVVSALTASAGLHPSSEEIRQLAALYPALRSSADRLYLIASDADPAPTFDPVHLFRAGSAREVPGER